MQIRVNMNHVIMRMDTIPVDTLRNSELLFPKPGSGNDSSIYNDVHIVWLGPAANSTGGPAPWDSIFFQKKADLANNYGITVHDGGAGGSSEQDAFDFWMNARNAFYAANVYHASDDTFAFNRVGG
jgi:hypothetical protein